MVRKIDATNVDLIFGLYKARTEPHEKASDREGPMLTTHSPRPAVLPNVCISQCPSKISRLRDGSRIGVYEGHLAQNVEAPWD